MSEAQKTARANVWNLLSAKRVLEATDPLVARFLVEGTPGEKRPYTFREVHLRRGQDFAEASQQFNQALLQKTGFGENADALFDRMTDLTQRQQIPLPGLWK